MACYNTVGYGQEMWSYIFVNPDMFGIDGRDTDHLMWNVIDLYKKEEDSRDIEGNEYEGRLSKDSYGCIGGFSGPVFKAELDTPKGRRNPSIMLLERIDAPAMAN